MLASMERQIRVFVIDPQPLIAEALQYFLAAKTRFVVVGTAQTVKALVLRTVCPDVILLGQEHGATDLCDMVAACRAAAPSANICVVACHMHPDLLPRVIAAGADGYAIKDAAPTELIDAVIQIYNGSTYIDPRMGASPLKPGTSARRARPLNRLTARETEVLKLIADGYSNREISIALSLSEKTIKNHISRIFAKLHITARTQAVIHAIKTGIA
jgi:DNA-binding NarL/FixJ family response regulator